MDESELRETPRTALKRRTARGSHDRSIVNAILDEAFVCHLATVIDDKPYSIPTAYARRGDRLLLHGSTANRMMRALAAGAEACVSVTLVDGLVLARSAFHHSVNYRSVVLFGTVESIADQEEKRRALRDIVEHIAPGRSAQVREPNAEEIAQTLVLAIPIDEGSAKVRSGPPVDDEKDYEIETWAGVLPLPVVPGEPETCPRVPQGVEVPENIRRYRR
jgi:nitroimidazol reductase NimA-like FMN-containing flavoprotein (pyridoxamine 5'-phosphate oxidase superfamily)